MKDMNKLIDRLIGASNIYEEIAIYKKELGLEDDYTRLRGKAQGIRLALSFARDYI